MKTNPNLKLRKLGAKYIIVQASADQVDMSNVYTMNASAAYLWERAAKAPEIDLTAEIFAAWLVEEYDIDKATASADAAEIFETWTEMGLIQ